MPELSNEEILRLKNRWKTNDDIHYPKSFDFIKRVFFTDHFHTELDPDDLKFISQSVKSILSIASDFPKFVIGWHRLSDVSEEIPEFDLRYFNDTIFNSIVDKGTRYEKRDAFKRFLPFANFEYAHLSKYNFKQSYFYRANFRFSYLTKTCFSQSIINMADFRDVDGYKTIFKGVIGESVDFRKENDDKNISLKHADYSGAIIEKSDFRGSDLNSALFKNANLSDSDIRCSDLTRADFREAVVSGVTWHDALKMRWKRVGEGTLNINVLILPSFEYQNTPIVHCTKISNAEFANSENLEKYIKDEQFIQESVT